MARALDFSGATGNRLNLGHGGALDTMDAGTVLAWVYTAVGSTTSPGSIYVKSGGATYKLFDINYISFIPATTFWMERARATQSLLAQANASAFAHWGKSKWCLVGCGWNHAGGNTDQKLWCGDTLNPPAEPNSYAFGQRVGTGAQMTDAGDTAGIGNNWNSNHRWQGLIGPVGIWTRRLTAEEIAAWWYGQEMLDGMIADYGLGDNGTSTQPNRAQDAFHGTLATGTYSTALGPPLARRRRSGGAGFGMPALTTPLQSTARL